MRAGNAGWPIAGTPDVREFVAVSAASKRWIGAGGRMKHKMQWLTRACCIVLATAYLLCAANIKLYLKDGTYQLAREYKVENDRVSFLSADRGEWEEIPAALVDLDKTKAEIKRREETVREEAAAADAEEKAERQARKEVEQIPVEEGVYLIEAGKLIPMKPGESKIVTDKKRSVLKVLSPIPLVSGKATLE